MANRRHVRRKRASDETCEEEKSRPPETEVWRGYLMDVVNGTNHNLSNPPNRSVSIKGQAKHLWVDPPINETVYGHCVIHTERQLISLSTMRNDALRRIQDIANMSGDSETARAE